LKTLDTRIFQLVTSNIPQNHVYHSRASHHHKPFKNDLGQNIAALPSSVVIQPV
jgi:hypothetical protein